jgi:hypothetical protein
LCPTNGIEISSLLHPNLGHLYPVHTLTLSESETRFNIGPHSILCLPIGVYLLVVITRLELSLILLDLMIEGSIFLYRRYVCCTVVSARVYPRCHGVQLIIDSVHPLSLRLFK